MSILTILEIGVGLALLYLLLSLVSTSVMEMVAGLLNRRGDYLRKGLATLLGTGAAVDDFYRQALIKSLSVNGRHPQYLPPALFVMALLHKLAPEGKAPSDFAASKLPPGWAQEVAKALEPLAQTAGAEIGKFRKLVEDWFNAGMDRVSALYKKNTQLIVFGVAVALTTFMNANTIRIAEELYRSSAARASTAAAAKALLEKGAPAAADLEGGADPAKQLEAIRALVDELQGLELPIGWTDDSWHDLKTTPLRYLLGLMLTALAVSLGAPFWFDVLSRFMVVRTTVRPGEKTKEPEAAQG